MQVIRQAGTASDVVRMFEASQPDPTLMDLRLPDRSGVEAIREIRVMPPKARIIVLTDFDVSSAKPVSVAVERFDFYAQDTWRVNSRFTLNYGARLDHIAWWYDKNGNISVFNAASYDPKTPASTYSGMQTHTTHPAIPISGAKPLSFQFAPSAGFAINQSRRPW